MTVRTAVCMSLAQGAILLCSAGLHAIPTSANGLYEAIVADPQQQRRDAIRQAQVWTATRVASMDIKAGPRGPLSFGSGAVVTCTFVDHPRGNGSTRKFTCALPSGEELKVRYGKTNGEVYAQVVATRLMWALGFGANRMYPVSVACRGCSADPFKDRQPANATAPVIFDPATIDDKADGETIETKPDQGWSWKELDEVDERAGGASLAQRDALKLLAVLMQHSSNKPINQRLVCLDKPTCAHSMMMIADVGKTFGRANALNHDATAAVNFKEWSGVPIWKEVAPSCVGHLSGSLSGSLSNPRISEGGRKFLADLLAQLTDAQIHDLFEVGRVTRRDPTATIDEWVKAFKGKRTEIVSAHCAP